MSRLASVCLALTTVLVTAAPSGAHAVVAVVATVTSTDAATGTTEPTEPTEPAPTAGPGPGGPVLVIGDSLTWRGADELVDGRRGWTVDGVRGRNVRELLPVLHQHLEARPRRYGTVVIALGTNTAASWRKRHYDAALRMVPARARTVLVTPYRAPDPAEDDPRASAPARRTATYATWMQQLASARPHRRCVAHWRALAIRRPAVLDDDGVHQTSAGEHRWAELIDDAVTRCAAR